MACEGSQLIEHRSRQQQLVPTVELRGPALGRLSRYLLCLLHVPNTFLEVAPAAGVPPAVQVFGRGQCIAPGTAWQGPGTRSPRPGWGAGMTPGLAGSRR